MVRLVAMVVALGCAAPAWAQQAAPPPSGWSGELSAGGSVATGNTQRKSADADGRLSHREGRLEDRFRLAGTVAWETGTTVAKRVEASAQSRYEWRPRAYTYGLAEYNDDRFSGFRYEAAASAGVGYRLIDTARTSFTIDAGPGYRYGDVKGDGENERELLARVGSNFRFDLSDSARITNEAVLTYDEVRTRIEDTVALTSKLIGNLSGRASFNVRYNSNPPDDIRSTDTLSKLSLVYEF